MARSERKREKGKTLKFHWRWKGLPCLNPMSQNRKRAFSLFFSYYIISCHADVCVPENESQRVSAEQRGFARSSTTAQKILERIFTSFWSRALHGAGKSLYDDKKINSKSAALHWRQSEEPRSYCQQRTRISFLPSFLCLFPSCRHNAQLNHTNGIVLDSVHASRAKSGWKRQFWDPHTIFLSYYYAHIATTTSIVIVVVVWRVTFVNIWTIIAQQRSKS
jgi:hypothetical protein